MESFFPILGVEDRKYGWFSQEAADKYGSVIWEATDGELIEITAAISTSDTTTYGWRDKRIVGEVKRYVRKGRSPLPISELQIKYGYLTALGVQVIRSMRLPHFDEAEYKFRKSF